MKRTAWSAANRCWRSVLVFVLMAGFVVFMERAQRRIPVQYAKRVVGRRVYGGQNTYLPLRVNTGGVIPVIFASSVVTVPSAIAGVIQVEFLQKVADAIRWGQPVYYVLYIGPETHRLRANEYIVTYGSILPEGVTASDPHILVFDEYTEVDGLVVPAHYTIYETDQSIYASCAFTDWSFSEPWDESWMEMPEGAVVDTTEP